MKRILSILTDLDLKLAGIGIVIMMVIVFVNALARYLAGLDAAWSYELVTSSFVLVSMFSAANVFKRDGHVGFDYLVGKLPLALQIVFELIRMVFCGIFFYIMVVYGIKMCQTKIMLNLKSAVLGYPAWIIGAFIPASGVLCIFHYLQSLAGKVKKWKEMAK